MKDAERQHHLQNISERVNSGKLWVCVFSWKEIARFLSIQSGAHTRKTESKSAENPTLQSLRLERRRLTIRSLPKMSHPLTLFVTPSKTQRARPMLMKNPRRSCFSSLCLWIYAARNPHIYQEMCTRLSALTFVLLCPRSDKKLLVIAQKCKGEKSSRRMKGQKRKVDNRHRMS